MVGSNSIVDRLSEEPQVARHDFALLRDLETGNRTYAPDADIVRMGDDNAAVYLLHEGWCCRYKVLPDGRHIPIVRVAHGDRDGASVGGLTPNKGGNPGDRL